MPYPCRRPQAERNAGGASNSNLARAKIYGQLDWHSALRAVRQGDSYQKHRVFFENEDTAKACGYRPCGNCMRAEYKTW